MTVEIISRSISTKVWGRAGIELATPGSAVRHTSVARHVTDCAMRPGIRDLWRSISNPLSYTVNNRVKSFLVYQTRLQYSHNN